MPMIIRSDVPMYVNRFLFAVSEYSLNTHFDLAIRLKHYFNLEFNRKWYFYQSHLLNKSSDFIKT